MKYWSEAEMIENCWEDVTSPTLLVQVCVTIITLYSTLHPFLVASCSDLYSFQARSISRYCFKNMCMVKVCPARLPRLWRMQQSHSFKDESRGSVILHGSTGVIVKQILPWRSKICQSHMVPSWGMENISFLLRPQFLKLDLSWNCILPYYPHAEDSITCLKCNKYFYFGNIYLTLKLVQARIEGLLTSCDLSFYHLTCLQWKLIKASVRWSFRGG